ncbi:hypothetical protein [Halalkalibacter hemicellulosilyticus]|uniref:Uncharacterized protein n=1 Tax=Halalkalibacter hemicellulosilyticusJCM 9152 TaxID=1236971 RepID=W4QBA6_9BACI|nr:hypothetical protein [Halalkalibacter hemicellulosilyticus]GAE28933.1 hypothetical protein JCM9152_271 [Halalkalibacter hemicellulosilyticusJCM 9152]
MQKIMHIFKENLKEIILNFVQQEYEHLFSRNVSNKEEVNDPSDDNRFLIIKTPS